MTAFVPLLVYAGAGLVATVVAGYFVRQNLRLSMAVMVWLGGAVTVDRIGIFPGDGVWQEGDVLRMLAFGTGMGLPVALYFIAKARSERFAATMDAVPPHLLTATQVYRLVGATFFVAYLSGSMPAEVALPAAVLDTFIGLTAIPLAVLLLRRPAPRITALWNGIGLFDFGWAFMAVSASMFGFWQITPAPSALGQSPFVLISLFQVPLAVIVHIEMLRRLGKGSVRTSCRAQG
ncbi:MAG: hypothetical protein AAGL89_13870 [Pseudomonadota bacterium]